MLEIIYSILFRSLSKIVKVLLVLTLLFFFLPYVNQFLGFSGSEWFPIKEGAVSLSWILSLPFVGLSYFLSIEDVTLISSLVLSGITSLLVIRAYEHAFEEGRP